MGTTRNAMTSSDGATFCFVLMIEGYSKLVTSHKTVAEVATAYAATDWSTVLGGLMQPEGIDDRMELWTGKFGGPAMRFQVANDQFGIDLHQTTIDLDALASSFEGKLDANFDSDDTVATLVDTSAWDADGDVHFGTEASHYTGKTATTLTGLTRGQYAPFKADTEASQRFGRPHKVSTVNGAKFRPTVSNFKRIWAGRLIRLMIHRITDGAIDTFAQAETIWAGRLDAITDAGSNLTIVEGAHVLEAARDAVLHSDQYTAKIKEGWYLKAGVQFKYREISPADFNTADVLDVVVSGATAPNEINAGFYTAEQVGTFINDWLAAEKAAANIDGIVSMSVISTTDGTRSKFHVECTKEFWVILSIHPDQTFLFMGWEGGAEYEIGLHPGSPDFTDSAISPNSPFRVFPNRVGNNIDVEHISGTWIDTPSGFEGQGLPNSPGWGVLQIGSKGYLVAHRNNDTNFDDISQVPSQLYQQVLGEPTGRPKAVADGILYDDTTDLLVKQIIVMKGTFKDLMLRMFASTGTAGYNHATYDVFDEEISLGLPWEVLGTSFEDSLTAVDETYAPSMVVILDKPTKFEEVLRPELLIRNAAVFLSSGELRITAPSTPSSGTYTLNTSNKGTPADAEDKDRSKGIRTEQYLKNKLTVRFHRTLGESTYRDERSVVNQSSIHDHGGAVRSLTIKARNTFDRVGYPIDDVIANLAPWIVGVFANSLTVVTRSINRRLFHMVPGETVALSDDHVRAIDDGTRGLSAYAGWLLAVRRNWRTMAGEVDIVLVGQTAARYAPYSPSCEMSSYNTGTKVGVMVTNAYSATGAAADASHFQDGDAVRLIEVSPADPASPLTWVDTLDGDPVGNDVTLTTGDGGQYDASKAWRMVSDDRATAQTSQQSDAYQADEDDGEILGATLANLWSTGIGSIPGGIPVADPTKRHRYPSNVSDDEGEPVSTAIHDDATITANNNESYRMAPQCPILVGSLVNGQWNYEHVSTDSTVYRLKYIMPWHYGSLTFGGGEWEVFLKVAPLFYRRSGAGTVRCRVTTCLSVPSGSNLDDVLFSPPFEQVEFTTTSSTPAFGSVSNLQIAGELLHGKGYICVELKAVNSETVAFSGLAELWRGPHE